MTCALLLVSGCHEEVPSAEHAPDSSNASSGLQTGEGPPPATTPASARVAAAAAGTNEEPGTSPCPNGEVFIPATSSEGFVMGSGTFGNDPQHRVVLTRPFCIDATEVTVAAYKECVDAGACKPPRTWGMWINYPSRLDHPVNKVGWSEARSYCQYREQDLPSEAQWEWAATGGDGRPWPWGDESPTCLHADFTPGVLERPSSDDGCRGGGTSSVGSTPIGDRLWPSGAIHDLAGNVWEWTLDSYGPVRFLKPDEVSTDPLVTLVDVRTHVIRGGGWNRSGKGIRAQYRGGAPVNYQVPGLGFRCVRPL